MPVCTVCSGTDFICESGYYFCSECQTQSQDIRVELNENDDFDEDGDGEGDGDRENIGVKRKVRSENSDDILNSRAIITSWEGFNLSLVGLIDELIGLGVKPNFKTTMLKLWTAYLQRMEVAFFNKHGPAVPKLGPNFKKNDAHLIYGYALGRDTKKKTEEAEPSNEDSENVTDERLRRKKALRQNRAAFRQNYEKMLREMSLASQTLTDVTLDMLAVSSIAEDENEPKELQHNAEWEKHKDIKSTSSLTFHPGLLVRNKLICLIYLGLLITDEKVKLSDLLRWISEGHISYSHLQKFLSSVGQLQGDNFQLFAVQQPRPPYQSILYSCGRLAAYIGLKAFKAPSLKDLIQHYTKELNLPAQVCLLAQRLLCLLPAPKDFVPTVSKTMPNWEGRAMAHIIISLKLLFGLDDATEHQNSIIARKINELLVSQNESVRLFVWDDWERFCTLRRTAFLLFHEPSFLDSKDSTTMIQNIKPIVSGWNNATYSSNQTTQRNAILNDIYKNVIRRLKSSNVSEKDHINKLSFPHTYSPYSSYVEVITRAYQEGRIEVDSDEWNHVIGGLNLEMLNQNFNERSVDYLTHPNEYIQWAQLHGLRVGLHNGAAVPAIWAPAQEGSMPSSERLYYRVKVYMDQVDNLPPSSLPLEQKSAPNLQMRPFSSHKPLIFPQVFNTGESTPLPKISDMEICADELEAAAIRIRLGRPTKKKTPKQRGPSKKNYDDLPKEDEENMLHMPHTEYWMLHFTAFTLAAELPSEASKLPLSFLNLLEECAYFLEMPPITLYKEVMLVENLHTNFFEFLSPTKPESIFGKEARALNMKDSW